MCRALLYLGRPVVLDNLLFRPDSALVRQSYMPKMLHLLNLAGFGMRAWDHASHDPDAPFAYASHSLPVFDRNLKNLAEKIAATCVLAHVRGVPYSTAVEISMQNVHPFQFAGVPLVMAHNGDLAQFTRLRPLIARHVKDEFAAQVRGTTDSEWIYALVVSHLPNPRSRPSESELIDAIAAALGVIRAARAEAGISESSSVNLFLADGAQLAAVRYCFDFGCFPTEDPALVRPDSLRYASLWYTLGRDYGPHDGEWKMTGGAEHADALLVASEPLSSDTAAWVEVPEYGVLHAALRDGRPTISQRLLD
ncbi:MAG: class II glutamine amidotransferase [Sphingomonadaceae bacterium]